MNDVIYRQAAIDAADSIINRDISGNNDVVKAMTAWKEYIEALSPAQPEVVRCKDCKFYSPMNRETKTGICNLIMHQNFGDNWFCAGAERRTDG